MLHTVSDRALRHRASRWVGRVIPHLPHRGRVLDIGSGTGHNARWLRHRSGLRVVEVDVADLSFAPPRPVVFDGGRLPFKDSSFDAVTMLFMLHYVADPERLLNEVRRVCTGNVVVVQSAYRGHGGRMLLALRELVTGRGALRLARAVNLVRTTYQPMTPRSFFRLDEVRALFARAGFIDAVDAPPTRAVLRREILVFRGTP